MAVEGALPLGCHAEEEVGVFTSDGQTRSVMNCYESGMCLLALLVKTVFGNRCFRFNPSKNIYIDKIRHAAKRLVVDKPYI